MEELKTNLEEVQEGISQEKEEVVEATTESVKELQALEEESKSEPETDIEKDSESTVEKSTKPRKPKGKTMEKKLEDSHEFSADSEKTVEKPKKKTTPKPKESKGVKAATYTVEECGKKARQLGTSREVVLIALREAGKKDGDLVSYAEAKMIILSFLKREVK